jgi:hypothetical protein
MKTNKLFLGLASLVLALAVFLTACTKNGINASSGNLSVYLTDGPGEYDSVFIDITMIRCTNTGMTMEKTMTTGMTMRKGKTVMVSGLTSALHRPSLIFSA